MMSDGNPLEPSRVVVAGLLQSRTGVGMDEHLRRAAKCILTAIESSDPDEQETMLNIAQSWLRQSEVARNADQHQPDSRPSLVVAK
jgi:hypothetical protein